MSNLLNIAVIVSVIALVIFIAWIWDKSNHHDYCDRWLDNIHTGAAQLDDEASQIRNQTFPSDSDISHYHVELDRHNADVDQYNRECYYPQ
jgi:hypothetical protein